MPSGPRAPPWKRSRSGAPFAPPRAQANGSAAGDVRAWFEAQFQPWALVNPDGGREGLITGYYEPVLKGSRTRKPPYLSPLFAPPEDMVVVDLAEVYPELKNLRLRGRLEGRKLVPYYTRAEWAKQEHKRGAETLLWIDDPLDLFFMQVQGSGQVELDDGSRLRVGYADQNGHPYRSIGKWLIEQGELEVEQASMQGIKAWARAHPRRVQEMLNANPSLVFFRELPARRFRSARRAGRAADARTLASPSIPARSASARRSIWPRPTPNDSRPLNRLMLAQDTGGAIRGRGARRFLLGQRPESGQPGRPHAPEGPRCGCCCRKGYSPN